MSSHGRRRGGPGPAGVGPAQLGWALLVIAAALIGGLAAATLVHASVVIAVIVSVIVGAVALLAMLRSPARPPGLDAGDRADFGGYQATHGRQAPTVPQAEAASRRSEPDGQVRGGAPAGHETVVQLLPLPPQPGQPAPPDAPWWDSAQGAPPPSPGARRAPAPDLSTYLASTFIAQCPGCGGFRLDIHRGPEGWNFRCESCDYTWTWQPGTPWPPVRVMPGGRPPGP